MAKAWGKSRARPCPRCESQVPAEDTVCAACGLDLEAETEKDQILARRRAEREQEEKLTRGKEKSGFWDSRDAGELQQFRKNLHRAYLIIFVLAFIFLPNLFGLTTLPLYIPIMPVFTAVFILAMVVAIERRVFFMGSLRKRPLDPDKLALLKTGRKKASSAYALGTAGLIIGLLLFNFPVLDGFISTEEEVEVSNFSGQKGYTDVPFMMDDTLGLTEVTAVEVETDDALVAIFVKREAAFPPGGDWEDGEAVGDNVTTGTRPVEELSTDGDTLEKGGTYSVRLSAPADQSGSATVRIERTIQPAFLYLMVLFSIIHLAMSVAWSMFLTNRHTALDRKYRKRVEDIVAEYRQVRYRLEDVFLVYRDGSLIAHRSRKTEAGEDNDIFMGMLTAVQDFVKDSLKSRGTAALDELKYGQMRILLERDEYLFLAVVLSGETPSRLRKHMKETLRFIHVKGSDRLANWDGDLGALSFTKRMVDELFVKEYASGFTGPKVRDENEWNDRGTVLVGMGRFEEAVECYEEALRINPRISDLWVNKASAMGRMGEYHAGLRSLEVALRLKPGDPAAKNLMAEFEREIESRRIKAKPCPDCGTPVRFVAKYKKYYCDACERYVTKRKKKERGGGGTGNKRRR